MKRSANRVAENRRALVRSSVRRSFPVDLAQGLGERVDAARRDQDAGDPVVHDLQRAAARGGNDGPTRGLRLYHGDPEFLDRGHHERPAPRVELDQLTIVDPAKELSPEEAPAQPSEIRTVSNDLDLDPRSLSSGKRDLGVLVSGNLADREEIVLWIWLAREAIDVDGRMDDDGVATVEVSDPLTCELRDRNEAVDPGRCPEVPASHRAE